MENYDKIIINNTIETNFNILKLSIIIYHRR